MIERLLPFEVASAETFSELTGVLHPAEQVAAAGMRPARRDEFVTGRVCARRALARLGHPDSPVPRGFRGAPRWPAGTVGSISHCPGYRVAVVASDEKLVGVGVDAEPNLPLPPGVRDSIVCDEDELRRLLDFSNDTVHVDRMLFSAKEAVYKLWFPLVGRGLGWRDVDISFDERGSFTARIASARGLDWRLVGPTGRWMVSRGLILTAVAVGAPGSPW
ncbi:4'-phosphopantetheinyl transferase superfamily protein [Cryobacterium sp. SO2]|uniref:4'-phosphopantetheinyl transferase family protein n=1 Tax=Cryobacterium sp. SO2 TaxID=1897060 RepID=UPI00223E5766|nr:4'-phosphopantetheinyl transferase superfamily protein [Cryobacterium sp. SO2]WEO77313.1 4'-phosphopantetheinyl transferase superfamily protein [Cryobacterium sp. SO2]